MLNLEQYFAVRVHEFDFLLWIIPPFDILEAKAFE
jgi:hypothetical protein